ncbi:sugar kinase [Actinoplanes sp. ATCC 53533]|uniref:ROK family protein n=1 Tax=Actinoplanes sp. ATCC 53533 TaxID=1288362 RepID=UPI000F778F4D|nr:ROK family protein [Actinoplanes sp. ATCC 53533]RSM72554.1 sugar kinase [Actinoplanes sp. ATCC 53533]
MSLLLGIDYGGTHSKLLLARDGAAVRQAQFPTHRGPGALRRLAEQVDGFLDGERPAALGVTIAGILDEATGRVVTSVNLPWLDGTDPVGDLTGLLGVAGVAVQDGHAAATAEVTLGAARAHGDIDDIFVLTLGTGIAGAHIVDGVLRRGAHNAAGEIGHMGTGEGRRCGCGQRGCLESEIGGDQLVARWHEAGGGIPAGGTAKDLVAAAAAGDERAVTLLDRATTALGRSLLGVIALLDPGLIIVGGGLAQAHEWIFEPAVRKTVDGATFHRLPPIVPAALGVWAGAWGATIAAGSAVRPSRH